MNRIQLEGILLTAASRVLTKNNDAKSQYVIYNAKITGPEMINNQVNPFLGDQVACAYTTRNAQGDVKELRHKGDEVPLYAEIVNGKPLFQLGSPTMETTPDADLVSKFQSLNAGQTV